MTEVGVERLGAGHREEDRAEGEQADHAVADEKLDPVDRIERRQDAGIVGDVDEAEDAAMTMNQTSVIGPKKAATLAVPRDCTANKHDQDDEGERQRRKGSSAGAATSSPRRQRAPRAPV